MGMVIVYGLITLLCNLAADLIQGVLDPRIAHA
jgi:ABC-type dipeptide/oligopeptide/nickel transport system permease component